MRGFDAVKKLTAVWRRNPVLFLIPLALAFSVLLTFNFPVYFRWDDVRYLQWAQTHPNPLAIFQPSSGTLFGTFRPMHLLTWWILFRLFHLQAVYYQLFLTFLYGCTFILFYLLVRRLYNAQVAWMSVAGYLVVFFPLGYIIFWFSDLTFVQELFWMYASLLLFHLALIDRGRRFLWGLPCYLCAILTKEPSVIIVTTTLALYAWAHGSELPGWSRRRLAWLLTLIGVSGMVWLLLSRSVSSRQGILDAATLAETFQFVSQRWRFYAGQLLAHGGFLLWFATFYLCGRSILLRRGKSGLGAALLLLALAAGLSFGLRTEPSVALVVLLAVGTLSATLRREVAPALFWGFLPLLALLGLHSYVRTYLVEASFGFAILLGLGGDAVVRSIPLPRGARASRILKVAGAAAVLAALVPLSGQVKNKLIALQVISDNRQNFRDVTEHLLSHPPPRGSRMAVVSYGDMDMYGRGIALMPDEEKGGFQKTIEPPDLPVWFQLNGLPDIQIYPTMKDYLEDRADSCYVWVMNNHEKKYVDGLPLEKDLLYEVHRGGEGAWLYWVVR